VAELQSADRLRPVSVVVASPYIGAVVQRSLAESGCANVRPVTLRQVAARVAGPAAHDTKRQLTGVLESAAIRLALQDAVAAPFATVAHHQSLHDGLGSLFRELRHLDEPTVALDTLATRGTVPQAAAATFRRFVELSSDYYDVPGLARIAATAADDGAGAWVDSLGALVLYLPGRLDGADVQMLGRLGRRLPIVAAFPHLGEPAADALMIETGQQFAAALGVALDQRPSGPSKTLALDVLSAPDPAEEARTVIRRLVGDLERGVPLWRIAVLYGAEDTHGGLVRQALDAAELPWHASTGRPLATCWAARSLLGLLGLPGRRFAREAVLEWLSGRPPGDSGAVDPLPSIPVSTWDRLSRQAQILEGPRQWVERFERLAHALEGGSRQPDGDAEEGARGSTRPADAAAADAIARAVARLSADLDPPDDGATWDAFVDWASDLRARYVPPGDAWPAVERSASDAVDAALESLREATVFEAGTTLPGFQNALASILASRRLPEGTVGHGVIVGPVGSVVGAAFDRVYVLGLTEGTFPSRPPSDALAAADGHDDPLARREQVREADRRGFLSALAAADGGSVTVSYARSDGGARATYPSRWLLELVSGREVETVYASGLPVLLAVGRPWLTRVASAQDGVARVGDGELAAADLADRRLASIVAWRNRGGDLSRHPLARRSGLPLGQALRASRARRSREFTPYDGNLGELVGSSELMARAFASGKVSATSLERWAACHFQYFLTDVLRVRATRRPEDEWTITAVDRGGVVHRVLERFFRELYDAGRLRGGDRITAADHERVEEIANEVFAELEQGGKAGHPLAWENARTAIVVDLHELLEKDQAWRDADGLVPARFEQRFGRPDDPDSWPAVTLTLADGTSVSFGGVIDRIDVAKGSSPRALIIDYKSGGVGSYKDLRDDPLCGGRHVQLALYGQALRSRLAETEPWSVSAEFRFVTARGGFTRLSVSADPSLEQRLGRVVQWVADGVGSGTFMPVPGARDRGTFANCGSCDYDRVCSTTRDDTWARKRHHLPMLDGPLGP
jgi:RecB family exonuclease